MVAILSRGRWVINALKTESCHDAKFALICGTVGCSVISGGATSGEKVGIMMALGFQWVSHTVLEVNIHF